MTDTSLFEMPREHRRQYVARLLGYAESQETWDHEMIDEILVSVERAAERELDKRLNAIGRNRRRPGWQI